MTKDVLVSISGNISILWTILQGDMKSEKMGLKL